MSYITSGRDPRAGLRGGVSGFHTDGVGATSLTSMLMPLSPAQQVAAQMQAQAEAALKKATTISVPTLTLRSPAAVAANVVKMPTIPATIKTAGGEFTFTGDGLPVPVSGPNPMVIGGLALAALVLFTLAKKVG